MNIADETWSDDDSEIECPHCGAKNDFSDDPTAIYTEDEREWDCRDCDKPFLLYGSMSWSWTATKKEAEIE